MAATTSFYTTGGTLRQDAPSYVERKADRDLYEGLQQGEYCYVLHARQMGKSSLMVHTTARLRQEGVAVVAFELTAMGQNVTVEQWYDGLLSRIGRELDLEEELEEYWLEHDRQSPLQRWLGALEHVVLAKVPRRIVLFLDEIDAVRSLPFSTDEFFAAIRECYNRRSQEPEFQRLTFCLLGVATPSDLIQDTRTTPFNIGRRIELTDFTPMEAVPLEQGLRREQQCGAALLERVLYWTGGHPYLTQRLCQAVAQEASVVDPSGVDRLCEELFLSPGAQEKDDNLLFVRERLLRSEADRAALLDLYGQVRSGLQVAVDDTNQWVSILRLSGITRTGAGRLQVRNRIYERVFDRAWVRQHMPDAELRRQRAAYRRGLLRAAAISGVILAVVTGLALTALNQAHRAQAGEREARRERYWAQVSLAQRAWEEGDLKRAQQLLKAQQPRPGQDDLRGFDWRLLWRLARDESRWTLQAHADPVWDVAVSPDGKTLATASADLNQEGQPGEVTLWDTGPMRKRLTLTRKKGGRFSVAFAPDGRTLATAAAGELKLWDLASPRELAPLKGRSGGIDRALFSSDGKILVTSHADKTIRLWEVASRREAAILKGHTDGVWCLALAPDGRSLASGDAGGTIRLWDVPSRRQVTILKGHSTPVRTMAFSPDGKTLASGSRGGTANLKLWEVASWRELAILSGHVGHVMDVVFSADGQTLASGGTDHLVRLWDVNTRMLKAVLRADNIIPSLAFLPDGRKVTAGLGDGSVKAWDVPPRPNATILRGHRHNVNAVVVSPDGKWIASGSEDGTIKLWNPANARHITTFKVRLPSLWSVAFSPDGKTLAACAADWQRKDRPGEVTLWDVRTKQGRGTLAGHAGGVWSVAFSPDGKTLATCSQDRTVKLWAVVTREELDTLRGHQGAVRHVAFSPDGRFLATSSDDKTVKLWDLVRKQATTTLSGHQDQVLSVAFSPDGEHLASGSGDGMVKLWDVMTGRLLADLKAHRSPVQSVAFSPDGKVVASGSWDGTVKLWNRASGQEVITLKEHESGVRSVAFSPDGSMLVTAGVDGTVWLWRAATLSEADAQVAASARSPDTRAQPLR